MYKAKIDNEIFDFEFNDQKGLVATINGEPFKIDLEKQRSIHHVIHNHRSFTIEIVEFDAKNKSCILKVNNQEIIVSVEDRYDQLLHKLGMDDFNSQKVNEVVAPMPGLVIRIIAKEGDQILKGDNLVVLEAMKMENMIKSPTDGIVKSIEVEQNKTVDKNQVLVKFE
ncbi:MAG: acetyl-CoA carboxylase biotin carboxyl carrier protein subunit [Flavobacteriales bacterium]|nr:acetyl-CoA carboxylase biotin carboxyl carrier protein subunit [Flavobacteriales bacterium]